MQDFCWTLQFYCMAQNWRKNPKLLKTKKCTAVHVHDVYSIFRFKSQIWLRNCGRIDLISAAVVSISACLWTCHCLVAVSPRTQGLMSRSRFSTSRASSRSRPKRSRLLFRDDLVETCLEVSLLYSYPINVITKQWHSHKIFTAWIRKRCDCIYHSIVSRC